MITAKDRFIKAKQDMNSSEASQTARTGRECGLTSQGTVYHTSSDVYCWLFFITVISIITRPITTVLNALIIVAVKTKNQVRTKSNIALACLSSTDAVYGSDRSAFFFIFWLIVELQGNTSGSYCVLISFSRASFRLLGITSLLHLAKVNAVEQYIAVKHSLCYEITVTEARLSGVSSLLWTITLLSTFLTNNNKYVRFDFGLTFLCVASIFSCQIVLFYETRRHKKKIAGEQVSVEAREKFLREKNALKLTTTIFFCLTICYLPMIISRMFISTFVISSVNSAYFVHFTGVLFVISNSLLNPIIHCVRMKQFQLALKESNQYLTKAIYRLEISIKSKIFFSADETSFQLIIRNEKKGKSSNTRLELFYFVLLGKQ